MALGKECPNMGNSLSLYGGFVTLASGTGAGAWMGCSQMPELWHTVGPSLPSSSFLSQFVKTWEIMSEVSIRKKLKRLVGQTENGRKAQGLPSPQ